MSLINDGMNIRSIYGFNQVPIMVAGSDKNANVGTTIREYIDRMKMIEYYSTIFLRTFIHDQRNTIAAIFGFSRFLVFVDGPRGNAHTKIFIDVNSIKQIV